jgi:hypothetical protein
LGPRYVDIAFLLSFS